MKKTKKLPKLMQLLRDNASVNKEHVRIRNESENEVTIFIYDVIDEYWGVSAQEINQILVGLSADVTVHLRVNSPGGDALAGKAIANAIRQFSGKVIAYVDGYAASAATTIVNAADEVVMGVGSFYMIHNAMTFVFGNKDELSKQVDLLGQLDETIIADYMQRTGYSHEQVKKWMDQETWFTAQEAVDYGFANRVLDEQKTTNTASPAFNLSAYEKVPAALLNSNQPEPEIEPDWSAQHQHNLRKLSLYDSVLT